MFTGCLASLPTISFGRRVSKKQIGLHFECEGGETKGSHYKLGESQFPRKY